MNRFEQYPCVQRTVQSAFSRLLGLCLLVAAFTLASSSAVAQFAGPTQLTLMNGWTDAPFTTSHAMVRKQSNIVQFRGAIAGGGTSVAFTLPVGFRPATDVYIPVDMCNATNGRLHITPAGVADVQPEGNSFGNAQCFTSLDGASFAVNAGAFTALTLLNGWTNAPFGTTNAAVRNVAGIIRFMGAIATSGSNAVAFTLPVGYRPATEVYVPVDLCNATKGRLHITAAGDVDVQAQGGNFSNAQCFTSLEGAWFDLLAPQPAAIILQNGWINAPFGTGKAAAVNEVGMVFFQGAIASGATAQVFTLPIRFRPVTNVYVPVDLCNAAKGRLLIQTSGVVIVQAESSLSDAQCFTSLDGVSFVQ